MLYILPLRNTLQHELKIYLDTRRPIWELDFINALIVGKATSASISCMTTITESQATLTPQRRSGVLMNYTFYFKKPSTLLRGLAFLKNQDIWAHLAFLFFCRKTFFYYEVSKYLSLKQRQKNNQEIALLLLVFYVAITEFRHSDVSSSWKEFVHVCVIQLL